MPEPSVPAVSTAYRNYVLAILVLVNTVNFIDRTAISILAPSIQSEFQVSNTVTGLVMGTPGYLSPEVVEGAPVTEATDWWGWAATLAFAASGAPPFGRGPMDVVLNRVSRGEPDLTGVDPRLARVRLISASIWSIV